MDPQDPHVIRSWEVPNATPASPPPVPAPQPVRPPRSSSGGRTVIAAALLSAILASAGTYAAVTIAVGSQGAAVTPSPTATPDAAVASSSGSTSITITASDADVEQVVAAARPAVVTIATEGSSGFGRFGAPTSGIGSGIILTTSGYILTNQHVVEGATTLTVVLHDGRQVAGRIVKVSDTTDLALVKIEATGLTAAVIGDASAIKVGQTAIAIGSPLGTYTETVTRGIISGLDRDVTVTDSQTRRPVDLSGLIQTDAAINEGNSGGPLLDIGGNVIGVNTAVATSARGLGFAIPITAASDLISIARAGTA
jgi:serine protease Do